MLVTAFNSDDGIKQFFVETLASVGSVSLNELEALSEQYDVGSNWRVDVVIFTREARLATVELKLWAYFTENPKTAIRKGLMQVVIVPSGREKSLQTELRNLTTNPPILLTWAHVASKATPKCDSMIVRLLREADSYLFELPQSIRQDEVAKFFESAQDQGSILRNFLITVHLGMEGHFGEACRYLPSPTWSKPRKSNSYLGYYFDVIRHGSPEAICCWIGFVNETRPPEFVLKFCRDTPERTDVLWTAADGSLNADDAAKKIVVQIKKRVES